MTTWPEIVGFAGVCLAVIIAARLLTGRGKRVTPYVDDDTWEQRGDTYRPMSYQRGPVCEVCWLEHGEIWPACRIHSSHIHGEAS